MAAILGIDAAWTASQPSGVALVSNAGGRWRCVAVAPSYATFVALAEGHPVDWEAPKVTGSEADPTALLLAAKRLLEGASVDVVTVDMPIATCAVSKRRNADNAISRKFGAAWCGVHSPTTDRPGPLGRRMTESFVRRGFPVATATTPVGTRPALMEVYPHTALLALPGAAKRLEYKIGKTGRTVAGVRSVWEAILIELGAKIDGIDLPIPEALTKARAKRYEDAIDAVVCAWVGAEYLAGRAVAYGDETAAIWCPLSTPGVVAPLGTSRHP